MRNLIQVLFLYSAASCSAIEEGPPPQDARPFLSYDIRYGLHCKPATGLLECLREHEPINVPTGRSEPIRRDNRLCLSSHPEATCFIDQEGLGYTLLENSGKTLLVIETEVHGGFSVIIIDSETGLSRRVDNRPLPSIAGGLFATVSYDTDAGYLPNRVVIWDENRHIAVYQFTDFAVGQGPTGIRWDGPSRLEVRYSRQPQTPESDNSDTFFIYKDKDGNWTNNYNS